MTQNQLARTVGKKDSEISRYARGVVSPRMEIAVAIDNVLGAGGDLVAAWGHAPEMPVSRVDQLQEQIDELIENVKLLTEAVEELRNRL